MIIASAIKVSKDGKTPFIVVGKRHHNCLETIWELGIKKPTINDQGFLTDENEFLNRIEAMNYAFKCGQIKEYKERELYSEDLW